MEETLTTGKRISKVLNWKQVGPLEKKGAQYGWC